MVSEKSDVFAFGVVLMEILSGLPALENDGRAEPMLARRGYRMVTNNRYEEFADERLDGRYDREQFKVVADVARMCCETDPANRPTMLKVADMLVETAYVASRRK